jgi:membrane protease YdiL (CAAX protease family)
VVGIVFGVGLLATGGNLWPLVIAHGLTDTVGLVAIYAGVMPR